MPDTSANLTLPFILPSQAQKHVTHNEALSILDVLVQLSVKSATLSTPPSTPEDGARYLVGTSATLEWAGHEGEIAAFDGVSWVFYAPGEGWRCWDVETQRHLVFDGTDWGEVEDKTLNAVDLFGLGTTATSPVPFQARLNQALWTALPALDGGDGSLVQVLNKETAGDDVGLVLQTGFAARALLGLFGSDQFRVSVTADGTNYKDALTVDNGTGVMDQPNLPRFKAWTNYDNFAVVDVWEKIGMNTVDYNDQGAFDPATNLFTAPIDGTYFLGGNLLFKEHLTSSVRMRTRLVLNGTTEINGAFSENSSAHYDMRTTVGVQTLVHLTQGDTVEIQGTTRAGELYFAANHSQFYGFKVG